MNQVPVPTVSDVSLYVQAVATRAPTDAWAVGSAVTGTYPYRQRPLVEHWNGRRWSIGASAPAPGGGLDAVSADAADDGWAVGGYIPSGASALQPLVEHWDGTSWMRITAPPSGYDEQLTGVSAGSPTDVWVAGVGDDASFIDH